jgi:heme A synthase
MLTTYRILAYTIAVLVGVQAASHAWASAGLGLFVSNGGVVDKSMMEDTGGPLPFPEVLGIIVHAINGGMIIPAVALALLVVSFFTRVKGAIRWAVIVLAVVALQLTLGYEGHALPLLAMFHGLNALVLFGCAVIAARVVGHGAAPAGSGSEASDDLAKA